MNISDLPDNENSPETEETDMLDLKDYSNIEHSDISEYKPMGPPRQIKRFTDTSRYSIDRPNLNDREQKFSDDTWAMRYHHIVSQGGYLSHNHLYKAMNLVDWLDNNSKIGKPMMFIDGKFLYAAVNQQGMFADMVKLAIMPFLLEGQKPYYYFQFYDQNNGGSVKVSKLLGLIKAQGMNLKIKPFSNGKPNESYGFADTLIPELMVDMISTVIDEQPEVNHILVFCNNEAITPAVKYIRELEVKVTLGIAKNQPVSNSFMRNFDYIINAVDLLEYSNVVEPFRKEF